MTRQSALLVVDVQNDFCPGGALAVTDGDKVIKPLNNLAIQFFWDKQLILYSRDWHPRETKHFKEFGGLWPVHCVQNTAGADFHPKLNTKYGMLVTKGTSLEDDGYSPFEGKLGGIDIDLHYVLQVMNITDLYVGGLATDYCVKAACLDARRLGYTTYLLTDACKAVNINNPNDPRKKEPKIVDIILHLINAKLPITDENIALEEMRRAGVIFTTTVEVITKIARQANDR